MTQPSASALQPPPRRREVELRQGFARAGVECLTLSTYARLDLALLHFARQRRHRQQGAASGAGAA